jgi:preprotein translocase subunit SecG
MQAVIVVIHLMVVITMIGVVLLQKSEGGGLGIGSTGGFLSSRGTSNVLTRTTAVLAGVFFATSLTLSVLAGWGKKTQPIVQGGPAQQTPAQPANTAPGGVLDMLRQNEQQPAPSPPPGGGPQIPRSE